MQQTAALFGPVVEVRDVLESFLRDQVLVSDWRRKLAQASRQLVELGTSQTDGDLVEMARQIAVLAESDLVKERNLARTVATGVSAVMDRVRVPNLPRPEDEDWSF